MFGLGFIHIIILIALLIYIFLAILIPFFIYSAQKWARKSYKELLLIRTILQENKPTNFDLNISSADFDNC